MRSGPAFRTIFVPVAEFHGSFPIDFMLVSVPTLHQEIFRDLEPIVPANPLILGLSPFRLFNCMQGSKPRNLWRTLGARPGASSDVRTSLSDEAELKSVRRICKPRDEKRPIWEVV